jgi:hypothetical protein
MLFYLQTYHKPCASSNATVEAIAMKRTMEKRCELNDCILPGNGFSFPVGAFERLLY